MFISATRFIYMIGLEQWGGRLTGARIGEGVSGKVNRKAFVSFFLGGRTIKHFAAQEHVLDKVFLGVVTVTRSSLMTLVVVWFFLYTKNRKEPSLEPAWPSLWTFTSSWREERKCLIIPTFNSKSFSSIYKALIARDWLTDKMVENEDLPNTAYYLTETGKEQQLFS